MYIYDTSRARRVIRVITMPTKLINVHLRITLVTIVTRIVRGNQLKMYIYIYIYIYDNL